MSADSVKQDVKELLKHIDKTRKGDWKYYSIIKRELCYLCGLEAVGIVPPELYQQAEKYLIKTLEV